MRMKTAIMTKIKMMMTMSHFPSDYVHKMHKCLFILFKQVYTHDSNKIIQGISLSLFYTCVNTFKKETKLSKSSSSRKRGGKNNTHTQNIL